MVYDRGSKLYVPVFYVLAGSKCYEGYWNLLQYITDSLCGESMAPHQVVCDFESPLIHAMSDWFPSADIIGCLFQFKQACQRKIRKYRISPPEMSVAMEKGVLDMLTVIPREKIPTHGIAWVQAKIQERCRELALAHSLAKWGRFWSYFRRTWLRLLPSKYWNVHGIRQDVVARTNNPLERFNRELNAAFATPHQAVPRFVQTIEEISRSYVRLREDISRGVAQPPRRATHCDLPTPVELPDVTPEETPADDVEEASGSDSESGLSSDSEEDNDDDVVI